MIPPYLQLGDTIAIVSTARKITEEELQTAIRIIEAWGFKVKLGNTIGAEQNQFAGSDQYRAKDFQNQLNDPAIKAILCARGGYGTARMVDQLDFTRFATSPKWIIGYSDVTVLHNHIHTHFGINTLHATMPINFATNTDAALDSFKDALLGKLTGYKVDNDPKNRLGSTEGELVGGNLSILYSLAGTPSDIDTTGKILFLEDLDEYLYHVDRILLQLKRAGKLSDLAGLIIGGMSDMNDNTVPYGKTAEEIIVEHTAEYNYPITFGLPAGHMDDNRALYMGRNTKLEVNEQHTQLTFL